MSERRIVIREVELDNGTGWLAFSFPLPDDGTLGESVAAGESALDAFAALTHKQRWICGEVFA